MEINILIVPNIGRPASKKWLERLAGKVLSAAGVNSNSELSLMLTDQEKIRELNAKYLDEDRPTDVLSFQMLPEQSKPNTTFIVAPDGVRHLGEVIISYPQAVIQAREHKQTVKKEIAILLIHGVLHLLGHDHAEPIEQKKMRAEEARILERIEGEMA